MEETTVATTARQGDVVREADTGHDRHRTSRASRWQRTVGVAGLVAVLWAGSNLYEVIDRGSVGPGGGGGAAGHGPAGGVPTTQPMGGGHQGPPSGGHGPS